MALAQFIYTCAGVQSPHRRDRVRVRCRVRVSVRVRGRVRVRVRVRVTVRVRGGAGLLRPHTRVGQIAIFSHCQP